MKTSTRALLAIGATVPLVGLATLPASAAPPQAVPLTVECGSTTYQVWENGIGEFTPVHDLGSTSVLIPLAFGESTFTVTDPNGVVVDSGSDPGAAKGSSARATGAQWCTYTLTATDEMGFTFTVHGDVLGRVTPAR